MDIEIYEIIIKDVIDYIKENDLIMVEICNKVFKSIVLGKIESYANNLNKEECKKIIKSYGSYFEVLRIYNDDDDINELFNNNENNFYKELARFVIYKRWFDESHKLATAYENVAEIIIENKTESENENDDEKSEEEQSEDDDKSETEY